MHEGQGGGAPQGRRAADDYHLRGILGQAFGIPPDTIDLTYPSTSEQER
jgi:hypothetical protein